MYRFLRSTVIIGLLVLPLAVNAQTTTSPSTTDLIAQVQTLLAKIHTLQGGTTPTTTGGGVGVCPAITRSLSLGASGVDVSALQEFLAQNQGIYPEGLVTGYFGALTQKAVQRWQAQNGIVSSGSPSTTGYGVVGPRTITSIKAHCTPGVSTQSGPTPPILGAVIQVTPVSGPKPLTVNVAVTVNTAHSCTGGTYALNYGDGSTSQQINVTSGNCNIVSQSFTHTYQIIGTHTITISSGTHQATATIVVGNAPAQDSLASSAASSTSPLSVTFTGVAVGQDAGSCTANCTDQLTFGDGTSIAIPLPTNSFDSQSFTVVHTYATAGTYTANLTSSASGSAQVMATTNITVVGMPPITTYSIISVLTGVGGNQSVVNIQMQYPPCAAYTLDWGDGTTPLNSPAGTGNCTSQSTAMLTHTYATNGTVTLRLTDGSGVQKATAALTIANVGTVSPYGISSITPLSGTPLTVSAKIVTPSCPTYTINWGDSSTPTSQSAATGCTGSRAQNPSFTHTYSQSGSYSIVLKDASSTIQSTNAIVLSN